MITFLIFIAVIGVLVLVHEFGHFIMARRAGMKVEEFGFGFPPRLLGIKKGETLYSINLIPFGGFVKILGEDGDSRDNPRSFGAKSIWARFKVIVAGVTMNLLFAVLLLILGNFFGLRIGIFDDELSNIAKDKKIQIIEVSAGSPAEKSDLKMLDEIVGFNSIQEIQDFTKAHRGETIDIQIKRGNEILTKKITTRADPPRCEGSMGIVMASTGIVSYPWYEAIWRGALDAINITWATVYQFYLLANPPAVECPPNAQVTGPIGIAGITGQAARVGFSYLMQFVALISINLAILNIIPFPALDGGRAVFLIIEKFKGKPIDKKIEGMVNSFGFALLLALMIYVTIKDLVKIFTV
jgi:regulator of sigma E protease